MIHFNKNIIDRIKYLPFFTSALFLHIMIAGIFFCSSSALFANEARHHQLSSKSHTKPILGIASFYGAKFNGRRTASGEKFTNSTLTAAHKTLPFGSKVQVTNLRNGKSVVVRINDRGPFVKGRIIDLSKAAAKKIGLNGAGTSRVELFVLKN